MGLCAEWGQQKTQKWKWQTGGGRGGGRGVVVAVCLAPGGLGRAWGHTGQKCGCGWWGMDSNS